MDDPFAGWMDGPAHPRLTEDEAHIWGWSLAGGVDNLARVQALLSEDELSRMRAFRFAPDAERYARARAGLRRILGGYLEMAPMAVRFAYGEHGKPSLVAERGGLHFNLSHTQGIAVAALSAAGPVGIDVEERRPVSRTLGGEIFSDRELAEMQSLSNEDYVNAFFNGWTRKEAVCKAEGLGFQLPLRDFSVSVLPTEAARVEDAGQVLSRDWFLAAIPLEGAATGCVAMAAPSKLRMYRVPSPEDGSRFARK